MMEITNEELVKVIQSGADQDGACLVHLWTQNRGLLYRIAEPFTVSGKMELEDLMQESFFGVLKAIESFDHDKGAAFTSWLAVCVRSHLQRVTASTGSVIRIPEYQISGLRQGAAVWRGGDVTTAAAVRAKQIASLDAPLSAADGDESLTLADVISDGGSFETDQVETLQRVQLRHELMKIINGLSHDEGCVIRLRWFNGYSFAKIAEIRDKPLKEVKRLYDRAMRGLKDYQTRQQLVAYWETYSAGIRHTGLTAFRASGMSATERAALHL